MFDSMDFVSRSENGCLDFAFGSSGSANDLLVWSDSRRPSTVLTTLERLHKVLLLSGVVWSKGGLRWKIIRCLSWGVSEIDMQQVSALCSVISWTPVLRIGLCTEHTCLVVIMSGKHHGSISKSGNEHVLWMWCDTFAQMSIQYTENNQVSFTTHPWDRRVS